MLRNPVLLYSRDAFQKFCIVLFIVLWTAGGAKAAQWSASNVRTEGKFVEGGWEKGGEPAIPVCLGLDPKGQLRPGKSIVNNCNIVFDGKEIEVRVEALLTGAASSYSWEGINSPKPTNWKRFRASTADGKDIFVCRAKHKQQLLFDEGMHPGELYGAECRYGFGNTQNIVKDDVFTEIGNLFNSPYAVLYVPRKPLSAEDREIAQNAIDRIDQGWREKNGFINIKREGNNDLDNENPVLFTSEYYFLLKKLGLLQGTFRENEIKRISESIDNLRLEPGLFDRVPFEKFKNRDTYCVRHFSRDEQIGLVLIDWAFDYELGLSRELFDYGRANGWRFENRTWRSSGEAGRQICDKGTWMNGNDPSAYLQGQRTPKFIGLLEAAAQNKVSATSIAEILGGLKLTKDRDRSKTSGKILAFLRKEILINPGSDAIDSGFAQFENAMYDQYGANPLKGLFSIYFKNPDHPFHELVSLYQH